MESSFNSKEPLVGSWLFCIEHLPCLVSFRCIGLRWCGGLSTEVSISVYEGQTYLGMPRGAKENLALNEPT